MQVLLDPSTSKHKLLHVLRKLDCYRLQLADLSSTHIGQAAATLAVNHPREVRARACSMGMGPTLLLSQLSLWTTAVPASLPAFAFACRQRLPLALQVVALAPQFPVGLFEFPISLPMHRTTLLAGGAPLG